MTTFNNNSLPVNLEDNPEDILQKAAKGLGKGKSALMQESGLSMIDIEPVLDGDFNPETAYKLAGILGLDPIALVKLGEGSYEPEGLLPEEITAMNRPFPVEGYQEMTVNSYLLKVPDTQDALLFDAGDNFDEVHSLLEAKELNLSSIFITHRHPDHISNLDKFKEKYPSIQIFSEPNRSQIFGSLTIKSIPTPGHSQDGISFLIDGLSQPVAIVGDAIFAGSIGGIPSEYPKHLETLKGFLSDLDPNSLIAPGHGPCTTAKQETQSNPFFAKTE